MAKFKVGDVVYLKSNSPLMTVSMIDVSAAGYESPGKVSVCWYDGGKFCTDVLNQDMLELSTSL